MSPLDGSMVDVLVTIRGVSVVVLLLDIDFLSSCDSFAVFVDGSRTVSPSSKKLLTVAAVVAALLQLSFFNKMRMSLY